MLINIVLVLQRFQIEKADPDYKLRLRCNITTKPDGFKMRVRRRVGRGLMVGIPGGALTESAQKDRYPRTKAPQAISGQGDTKSVTAFFGGNTGTCESLAQDLSKSALGFGLEVDIQNLDSATENLPTDRPCVIITTSYEGKPPDNAKKFVAWIEQLSQKSAKLPKRTQYAVFGVGNSDWASTFHRIPKLVNDSLAKLGAEQIIESSFADVKLDMIGPWEEWSEQLCMNLSGNQGASHACDGVEICIESGEVSQMLGEEGMTVATVVSNCELADMSAGAAKRHVEVRLPTDCEYTSGDYLVIQGRNSEESVRRVMVRFGIGEQDVMSVKANKKTFLPKHPVMVYHFLRDNVDLAAPITKRQLVRLTWWAKEGSEERKELEKMQDDSQYGELLEKRHSVIDTLERVPGLHLPFGVYVDLLQPLTPRPYSISSSPLEPKNNVDNKGQHAVIASVTIDVFRASAWSGHGTFHGVASSYLADRQPGDRIGCFVRSTNVGFRLPANPETPVIMLAAGTGIAPMRAFIQERAAIKHAGVRKLGAALLFFGCRHPDRDYLYRTELAAWEREGVVEVIPCFSKPGGGQKGRHVPDALWEDRERVWDLFNNEGRSYLCGCAAKLGRRSAQRCRRIWREKTGKSEAEAEVWLEEVKNDRYVSDVY